MMTLDRSKNAQLAVRWCARLTSLGVFSLLLLFASNPSAPPTPSEMVALAFFPMGLLIGFGVSWWRESLGGYVSLASLACFYTWMLFTRGTIPSGPYFAICVLPSVLFLISGHLERSKHV